MDDHYDNIYFEPIRERLFGPQENIIGYLVDPKTTYVYNQEYRAHSKRLDYLGSRQRLEIYLTHVQQAQKMEKNAPPLTVVLFDPKTSVPFYASRTDQRRHDALYYYLAEVIVTQPRIAPEDLIFFDQDDKSDKQGTEHRRHHEETKKTPPRESE
ncbi:MAG: hypothetical protein WBQ73_00905 [Candidatus Babeliales bacterium]